MTLEKKTLYIYKLEKIQSYKKTEQNTEAKKIENGCASKVLAVGSSTELSSLL